MIYLFFAILRYVMAYISLVFVLLFSFDSSGRSGTANTRWPYVFEFQRGKFDRGNVLLQLNVESEALLGSILNFVHPESGFMHPEQYRLRRWFSECGACCLWVTCFFVGSFLHLQHHWNWIRIYKYPLKITRDSLTKWPFSPPNDFMQQIRDPASSFNMWPEKPSQDEKKFKVQLDLWCVPRFRWNFLSEIIS